MTRAELQYSLTLIATASPSSSSSTSLIGSTPVRILGLTTPSLWICTQGWTKYWRMRLRHRYMTSGGRSYRSSGADGSIVHAWLVPTSSAFISELVNSPKNIVPRQLFLASQSNCKVARSSPRRLLRNPARAWTQGTHHHHRCLRPPFQPHRARPTGTHSPRRWCK